RMILCISSYVTLFIFLFFLFFFSFFFFFFFFSSRRRHTRSYGDWSSDVCSSDLFFGVDVTALPAGTPGVIDGTTLGYPVASLKRSEERRVGKECRSRGSPEQ